MTQFTNKTVLITGGASGIGKIIAGLTLVLIGWLLTGVPGAPEAVVKLGYNIMAMGGMLILQGYLVSAVDEAAAGQIDVGEGILVAGMAIDSYLGFLFAGGYFLLGIALILYQLLKKSQVLLFATL